MVPEPGDILDLGCGSGEPLADYLAQAGHALTGVDTAPALIALARARFPKAAWVVADMRSPALERWFGGLLAWDSFFHLPPAGGGRGKRSQCGVVAGG